MALPADFARMLESAMSDPKVHAVMLQSFAAALGNTDSRINLQEAGGDARNFLATSSKVSDAAASSRESQMHDVQACLAVESSGVQMADGPAAASSSPEGAQGVGSCSSTSTESSSGSSAGDLADQNRQTRPTASHYKKAKRTTLFRDFFEADGAMDRLRGVVKPCAVQEVRQRLQTFQELHLQSFAPLISAFDILQDETSLLMPKASMSKDCQDKLSQATAGVRHAIVFCNACQIFGFDSQKDFYEHLRRLCPEGDAGLNMYSQLTGAYCKQLCCMGKWLVAEVIEKRSAPTIAGSVSSHPLPPGLVPQTSGEVARNPNEGPTARPPTRTAQRKMKKAAEAEAARATEASAENHNAASPPAEQLVKERQSTEEHEESEAKVEYAVANSPPGDAEPRTPERKRHHQKEVTKIGTRFAVVKHTFIDDPIDTDACATSVHSRAKSSPAVQKQESLDEPKSPEEANEEADEFLQAQVDFALYTLKTSTSASTTNKASHLLAGLLHHSLSTKMERHSFQGLVRRSQCELLEVLRARPDDEANLLQVLMTISGQDFLQLWLEDSFDGRDGPAKMQLKDAGDRDLIPVISEVWAAFLQQSEIMGLGRTREWSMNQSDYRVEATCSLLAEAPASSKAAVATHVFEALPALPALGRSSHNESQLSKWLVEQVHKFQELRELGATVAGLSALAALCRPKGTLFGLPMPGDGAESESDMSRRIAVLKNTALGLIGSDHAETSAKSFQLLLHTMPFDEAVELLLGMQLNRDDKKIVLHDMIREVEECLDVKPWAEHEDDEENSDPSYLAATLRLSRLLNGGGLGSVLYSALGSDLPLRHKVLKEKAQEFQGSFNNVARVRFGLIFGLEALSSSATDHNMTPKEVRENMKAISQLTKLGALADSWESTLKELIKRDFGEDPSANAQHVGAMASIARVGSQFPAVVVNTAVDKILDAVYARLWKSTYSFDWMFEHYALWAVEEFALHDGFTISDSGIATIELAVAQTDNAVQVAKRGKRLLQRVRGGGA